MLQEQWDHCIREQLPGQNDARSFGNRLEWKGHTVPWSSEQGRAARCHVYHPRQLCRGAFRPNEVDVSIAI